MRGLVMMDRGVFNHPLFENDEFSRREAWLWLIAEASWKQRQVMHPKGIVMLSRGQAHHSMRFMARQWGWTVAKVQRFISRLKTDTMIDTSTDTGQLVITICNYEKYQKYDEYRDTATDTATDTAAIQTRTPEETPEETPEGTQHRARVRGGCAASPPPPSSLEPSPPGPPPPSPPEQPPGAPSPDPPCERPPDPAARPDLALAIAPLPASGNPATSRADDVRTMVEAWNDLAQRHGLPCVQKLTEARHRKARARLKDCGGLAGWKAALDKIRASPGLMGQTGDGGWKANFDFLMRESSFVKLMEGNYDGWTEASGRGGQPASVVAAGRRALAILENRPPGAIRY